jgi:hypothetical protein
MERAMPPKLREVKRWTNGGSKARRMTALLTRKWTVRSHIEEMEKLIVLAVLTAIVVFATTYALSAWSEHR